jgi:hypothetical protein
MINGLPGLEVVAALDNVRTCYDEELSKKLTMKYNI